MISCITYNTSVRCNLGNLELSIVVLIFEISHILTFSFSKLFVIVKNGTKHTSTSGSISNTYTFYSVLPF